MGRAFPAPLSCCHCGCPLTIRTHSCSPVNAAPVVIDLMEHCDSHDS